jgi:protein TonB
VASAAADAEPAPAEEPVPVPETELPATEVVVEPARPTDEQVAEELPELEAVADPAPVEWSASVPSVTARTRPAPPPTPVPTPVAAPVPTPPVVARPASVASTGASHVERASPLATNRRPAYPVESRRLGEQGTVVLLLTLGEDGSVTQVVLEQSSGYPRLDAAAVAAAWGWRFRPAIAGGTPVVSTARQRVGFRLDGP